MIAIFLCAGFATRMYPLTRNFPKPLLPVAGQPVIDYLMHQVVDLPHLTAIHVVTNHRFGDHFGEWAASWQQQLSGKSIELVVHDDGATSNDTRLGAAGDLQFVIDQLDRNQNALVTAGDNIYCFPIKPLWHQFRRRGRSHIVTLPETVLQKLRKTGVPEFGENQRVLRLHEKPQSPPTQWCCPPLYFFIPSVWQWLDRFLHTTADHDAPGHFIDYLVQYDQVYAFQLDARRLDIGSMETYRQADQLLKAMPELLSFDAST